MSLYEEPLREPMDTLTVKLEKNKYFANPLGFQSLFVIVPYAS